MSTLAFAALTSKRLAAKTDTSTTTGQPGVKPYVDAAAGLVPAEVLAAHAAIVGVLAKLTKDTSGNDVTALSHPGYARLAFYVLLVGSAGLYFIGRVASKEKLRWLDALLGLIPPASFIAWMLFQPTTVLDAVFPNFQVPGRTVVGILVVFVLTPLAYMAGYKADQSPSKPK